MSSRIILDTNVLVSAFTSSEGASREVLRQLLTGTVEAAISLPLYREYVDVMGRDSFLDRCPMTTEDVQALFEDFLSTTRLVELYFSWRPNLRDEGDNHVYELTVAAGDAVLLTYNLNDFSQPEIKFPNLKIMSPKQWLQLHRN
jgi:putative PIN family toxin of toxin-antitoxin system